jgi:flagellar biogenesis protein FliO
MQQTARDVGDTVRSAARSRHVARAARLGFAARATIYLLIGCFTLLLAFGKQPPEDDQRGAMQEVARHTGGFLLLVVLAIGLAAYALWRFSEAAFGGRTGNRKLGSRLKSFFRGCVYAALAYTAVDVLLHSSRSQAHQQQEWSAKVMSHQGGRWLVGLVGLVLLIVGAALVFEAVRGKFKEGFKLAEMPRFARRTVWILGAVGTTARGVVFGLTGFFVLQAAWRYDSSKARGLDGALRRLAASQDGKIWVTAAGLGLIAFGLYGYAEAAWRRT